MQEHCNSNYLERKEYQRAIYKGKIEKFNLKKSKIIAKQHQISGKNTIHGKIKKINYVGFLKKTDNRLELVTSIVLNIADFNNKIPAVVENKIFKTVNVSIHCVLQ